jgi:hypothetical protein
MSELRKTNLIILMLCPPHRREYSTHVGTINPNFILAIIIVPCITCLISGFQKLKYIFVKFIMPLYI